MNEGSSSVDPTLGTNSDFSKPKSLAVGWYDNVYVADEANNQVKMFCSSTSTYRTVVEGSSSTTPSITKPTEIAFDSNMNLYVTSTTPPRVYQYARI